MFLNFLNFKASVMHASYVLQNDHVYLEKKL